MIRRHLVPALNLTSALKGVVDGRILAALSKEFKGYRVLVKVYPKNILGDPLGEVRERLALVGGDKYHLSPKLRWVETECSIVTIQRYLPGSINRVLIYKELVSLSEILDHANKLMLVHGDINIKNVIVSDGTVWVVDWEPSLTQHKNGDNVLMATRPYIHPKDLRQNKLSVLTDLVGFYFLVNICKYGRDRVRKRSTDKGFCEEIHVSCEKYSDLDKPFSRLLTESFKFLS